MIRLVLPDARDIFSQEAAAETLRRSRISATMRRLWRTREYRERMLEAQRRAREGGNQ